MALFPLRSHPLGVISLDNGAACLMADKLLDCQPYHIHGGSVNWEDFTVRSWLNSYPAEANDAGIDYRGKGFLNMDFSSAQQQAIIKTQVENRPNGHYNAECGDATEVYVFLLSNDEVFSSETAARNGFYAASGHDDPAKRFRSTMYAKCRGAWWSSVNGYMGNSFWFMRTNEYDQESITCICDFGYIYQRGTISMCEDAGLLPALWIDTKLKLKMYQIWDGFYAVAKLNGGRRSSATLTGMKQRHGVKDTQR